MPHPTFAVPIVASTLMLTHACLAAGALAETLAETLEAPVRVLGSDGRWTSGILLAADAERWRILSSQTRTEQSIACSDIVAFLTERTRASGSGSGATPATAASIGTSAPEPISYGLLETTNGQRLPGNFRQGSDASYWDHRWIGSIPIAIDQVASIRFRGARTPEQRADGDTLLLMNGDSITGFLGRLGNDIEFEPVATEGAAAEKRLIPVDRVAALALAKGEASPARTGRFWVLDGSVVDGADLRFDAENGWGFRLEDPLLAKVRSQRTSDNNAANPIAGLLSSGGLTPLASLGKPVVSVPEGEFHLGISDAVRTSPADRALLGLAPIEIAGPCIASYRLPASGSDAMPSLPPVLSCEIALVEPAPADVVVDIEFRIGSVGSGPLRLDAAHRRVPLALALTDASATTIEVRVTDGGNGIAGDLVLLEKCCIVRRRR